MEGSEDPYDDGGCKKIDVEGEDDKSDEADAKVDGALAILQERDQGGFLARMGRRGVVVMVGGGDEW
jgi:hypothetical protein